MKTTYTIVARNILRAELPHQLTTKFRKWNRVEQVIKRLAKQSYDCAVAVHENGEWVSTLEYENGQLVRSL